MAKVQLRTASVVCLAIWLAIWLLFLFMRFSPLDIRNIPGIGPITLVALALALAAPIVATGLAGAVLVRQRRPVNVLTFGFAIAALLGQTLLFLVAKWR
jgi:hypothetical protein